MVSILKWSAFVLPLAQASFGCCKSKFQLSGGQLQIPGGCGPGVPAGYYPDLENCNAYCKCAGDDVPARYEVCTSSLVWDTHGQGPNHYLSGIYGENGMWGTNGGICTFEDSLSAEGKLRPGCNGQTGYCGGVAPTTKAPTTEAPSTKAPTESPTVECITLTCDNTCSQYGRKKDVNDCETCMCNDPPPTPPTSSPTPPPTTPPTSSPSASPIACIPTSFCENSCSKYGFVQDANGCATCACADCPDCTDGPDGPDGQTTIAPVPETACDVDASSCECYVENDSNFCASCLTTSGNAAHCGSCLSFCDYSWDNATLQAVNTMQPECYIMIFAEAECASAGGLYRITDFWYTNHYGGPFEPKNVCGTVVHDWQNKGSHFTFLTNLENGQDVPDWAIHITSEFDCGETTTNAPGETTTNAPGVAEDVSVVIEVLATFEDVLNSTQQETVRGSYCDSVSVTLEVNLEDVTCTIEQEATGIRRLLTVNYDLTAEMTVPAEQADAFERDQTEVAQEAMQMFVSDPAVTAANGGVNMTMDNIQVKEITVTGKDTGQNLVISGATTATWIAGIIATVASTMI